MRKINRMKWKDVTKLTTARKAYWRIVISNDKKTETNDLGKLGNKDESRIEITWARGRWPQRRLLQRTFTKGAGHIWRIRKLRVRKTAEKATETNKIIARNEPQKEIQYRVKNATHSETKRSEENAQDKGIKQRSVQNKRRDVIKREQSVTCKSRF